MILTTNLKRRRWCVIKCGGGGVTRPNLAEENGHEVVVDEEGLREVWVVKVEEERGEAQRDVLLRWRAEGRAQQLHACHRDEQSSAARWGGGTLLLTCTELPAEYEMIPNTKTLHAFQFDWKCAYIHITQNRRKHKYSDVGGGLF